MCRLRRLVVAVSLCAGLLTGIGRAQDSAPAERKVIERVAPVYPDLARRTHLSGVVKLEVVIRPNGTVKSVRAVGGNPVLIESAASAVEKWRFEMAREETIEIVQLSFR